MKKVLGCLGIGAIVCVVLLSGLLVWLILGPGKDIPAFDDSDLFAHRPEVADNDNAFIDFEQASNDLFWPEEQQQRGHYHYTEKNCAEKFLDRVPYEAEALAAFFNRNEAVFRSVREGVGKKAFQEPEITRLGDLMPYVSHWRKLARGLQARGRFHRQQGNYAEAVQDCLTILGFGDKICSNPEALISYLVGIAVMNIGLEEVEALVLEKNIPREELQKLLRGLKEFGTYAEGMKRCFQKEYQMSSGVCDDIASGKIAEYTEVDARLAKTPKFYLFQPNKTKKRMADYFRSIIEQADRSSAEYHPYDLDEELEKERKNKLLFFVRPNPIGRILIGLLLPALDRVHTRRCWLESEINGVKLMTAVILFERNNGSLPSALENLVPGLLDEVPRDPFDGKPFRYDRKRRLLYSVGKNLTDDGGSTDWAENARHGDEDEIPERDDMQDAVFSF